jgi:hypothetical protein
MRPSNGSSVTPEASYTPKHLDLPVDPEFRPASPTVPLRVLMARSADLQRWFPNGIPTAAERLASKCDVVFRLH